LSSFFKVHVSAACNRTEKTQQFYLNIHSNVSVIPDGTEADGTEAGDIRHTVKT